MLSRSQIEQLIEGTRLSQDGKNLYGICPFCGKDEFGISLEGNNAYRCFRGKNCGETGNAFTLLKKLGRVKEFLGEREIDVDGQIHSIVEVKDEEEVGELPLVKPPVGWKRKFEDEYLFERGVTERQFHKFQIGRSIFKRDYVTFLVEMESRVTGYISRSIKSKEYCDTHHILRYQNSSSDFSKMLFGYDEIVEGIIDVILVEGIFDKLRTDENLQLDDSNEIKCVATFGAKVSDEQIRLLKEKGVKRVWLWFEGDVLEKVKTVAAKLALHFDTRCTFIQGKDPGDMDEKETFDLFSKSVSYIELGINFMS